MSLGIPSFGPTSLGDGGRGPLLLATHHSYYKDYLSLLLFLFCYYSNDTGRKSDQRKSPGAGWPPT